MTGLSHTLGTFIKARYARDMNSNDLGVLLSQGAVSAAHDLIGWRLYTVEPDGTHTGGVIVETEIGRASCRERV